MPVITITSGKYTNAGDIVKTLSQELSCKVITDQDIFEETDRVYGINPDTLQKVINNKPFVFNDFTHTREKSIACLKKTLVGYVSSGNCIFQGLLGHLIPQQTSHVLKVLIITDKKTRAEIGIKKHGLSEKEVTKNINYADRRAILWTNALFGKKAWDQSLYDIVIPSDKFDTNKAIKLILEHLEKISEMPVDTIKREAGDFDLMADIELALSKKSAGLIVSTSNGDVLITINKNVTMLSNFSKKISTIASSIEGVKSVKTKVGGKYQPSIIRRHNFETPTRILLVDDEKEFVQTLSERLKMREIESNYVFSGKDALDFVDQEDTDVMILDLKMPGIDGFEVLKKIKKTKPNIEVIILTGHGSEQDRETCMNLGAFAYLQKPADIDSLTATMQKAYEKINSAKTELSE